jgi:hypothetical protein
MFYDCGPEDDDTEPTEDSYERPEFDNDGNEIMYDENGNGYCEDNDGSRYEPNP